MTYDTMTEMQPDALTARDMERLARRERALDVVCGAIAAAIVTLVLLICGTGCVYKGAKVTEGTDFSIGLSVPGTEGAASLTVLNYLSGFRLGVAQFARLELEYTSAETNDYFGIATTRAVKTVKATVEPCEAAPEAEPPATQAREAETESDEPPPDAAPAVP